MNTDSEFLSAKHPAPLGTSELGHSQGFYDAQGHRHSAMRGAVTRLPQLRKQFPCALSKLSYTSNAARKGLEIRVCGTVLDLGLVLGARLRVGACERSR